MDNKNVQKSINSKSMWTFHKVLSTKDLMSKNSICAICIDDKRNLYCSNRGHQICKLNLNSLKTEIVDTPSSKSQYKGVVWNNHDNLLYFCDAKWNRILCYDPQTGRTRSHAHESPMHFTPSHLTVDKKGHLIIADHCGISKIPLPKRIINHIAGSFTDGFHDGPTKSAQVQFGFVLGQIASADDGTIYVADTKNDCIRRITNDTVSTIYGGRHWGSNGVPNPTGLTLDKKDGSIWICNQNELAKIDVRGKCTKMKFPNLKKMSCCYMHSGLLYVGTDEGIFCLEPTWQKERFLWIAKLKEDASYCPLAALPTDTIKEIVVFFRDTIGVSESGDYPKWT